MELREEIVRELRNILGDLEKSTSFAEAVTPTILASFQETHEVLQHLLETSTEGTQSHQRFLFLTKMLELAVEEIEAGGVEDGLWFGKTVITFLLDGTSANSVPVEAEERS
ncbi:hypothetical protein [Rufibacter sp. XAAS-G3-1]|uniref:hypothetical protein n=1 Tax=Rufibacter sp. XAAS-G3-1 TaxID=2729134 RepID=UPI0015E74498|nr:hypothetical protein [Rufibacter sp. XAAS-G3-1]